MLAKGGFHANNRVDLTRIIGMSDIPFFIITQFFIYSTISHPLPVYKHIDDDDDDE